MKKLLVGLFLCVVLLSGCSGKGGDVAFESSKDIGDDATSTIHYEDVSVDDSGNENGDDSVTFKPGKDISDDVTIHYEDIKVEILYFDCCKRIESDEYTSRLSALFTYEGDEYAPRYDHIIAKANDMTTADDYYYVKLNEKMALCQWFWDTKKPLELKGIKLATENENFICSNLKIPKKTPDYDFLLETNDGLFVMDISVGAISLTDSSSKGQGVDITLYGTQYYSRLDEDDDNHNSSRQCAANISGTFSLYDVEGNLLKDTVSPRAYRYEKSYSGVRIGWCHSRKENWDWNDDELFKQMVANGVILAYTDEKQERYWLLVDVVPKTESPESQASAQASGDYILSDSSSRYLTENEIRALSKDEMRIARNEIYARHGRKFNSEDLQAYFNSKSWYSGTVEPDSFDESVLNEYEKANLDLIRAVEGN